jgi:hypothetical protein
MDEACGLHPKPSSNEQLDLFLMMIVHRFHAYAPANERNARNRKTPPLPMKHLAVVT